MTNPLEPNDLMGDCLLCEPDLLLNFARAALERWGQR